jgi:SAM-dependent methyltransferase
MPPSLVRRLFATLVLVALTLSALGVLPVGFPRVLETVPLQIAILLPLVSVLSPAELPAPGPSRAEQLRRVGNVLVALVRAALIRLRWLCVRSVRAVFGLPTSLGTPDRLLLEQEILPWFAGRPEVRRVLFIGCDWYTRHYGAFFEGREYWTLDKNAARRRHGSALHVVADVANLDAHFEAASFDLVVLNGVLGWGLDEPADAEAALAACAARLAPGGVFLIGWNDVPALRVHDPAGSAALRGLVPWPFPLFGGARRVVPGPIRHTYSFYARS